MGTYFVQRRFSATDLFRISPYSPCDISCLNWRIRCSSVPPEQDLAGPGVYGLCYRGMLIYIGSFRGTKRDPFAGNANEKRWWTHLGTLTFRGHCVSIHPGTKVRVLGDGYTLHAELRKAISGLTTRDRGCRTSVNRMLWANAHWPIFRKAKPGDVLKDFEYFYVRVNRDYPALTGSSIELVSSLIVGTEYEAIRRLQPIVNDDIPWTGRLDGCARDKAISVVGGILTHSFSSKLAC